MEEALDMVRVVGEVREALVSDKGSLAPVLDFMIPYETADWAEISRRMILEKIDMDDVSNAYLDSLTWYRELTVGTK